MKNLSLISFMAMTLLASTGCGQTVRYLTASTWRGSSGDGLIKTAEWVTPEAPSTESVVRNMASNQKMVIGFQGAPPAAAPPAPQPNAQNAPAAPAAGAGGERSLYLVYWEGTCGGVTSGCSKGNGKILRCNLKADNSLACVEEAEANKFLSTD